MKNQDGFTLIELIITVALLGILVSIAIPRLSQYGQTNTLRVEARKLQYNLMLTRQYAVSQRVNHILDISFQDKQYAIYRESVHHLKRISDFFLIDSAIALSGDTSFEFESMGNLSASSGTTLSMSSSGRNVTMNVNQLSGKISITGP